MLMEIHPTCYIATGAVLVGRLSLGKGCSIWSNAVIRADLNTITIGEGSNVQECSVIHCTIRNPVTIGSDCSLGHGCVVHGANIGNNCIIGMNATVLDGAEIGENSLIGANALVTPGARIPPGSLVVGVPGKVVKRDEKMETVCRANADVYKRLRDEHLQHQYLFHEKAKTDNLECRYDLLPLGELKEHEEIMPERLEGLIEQVKADGELKMPIIVDEETHVILDGHHRFSAIRSLGCRLVPVILVNYFDSAIILDTWDGSRVENLEKEDVLEKARKGEKFPPKTTKHLICARIEFRSTPLADLR